MHLAASVPCNETVNALFVIPFGTGSHYLIKRDSVRAVSYTFRHSAIACSVNTSSLAALYVQVLYQQC